MDGANLQHLLRFPLKKRQTSQCDNRSYRQPPYLHQRLLADVSACLSRACQSTTITLYAARGY